MARGRTAKVLTHRYRSGVLARRPDHLVVEEPLEIHLDGTLVATTMRTPGHDFELAVGFLHTEGLLDGAPVRSCRYCRPGFRPAGSAESGSIRTGSAVESEFNVVSVDTGGRAPTPTPRLTTVTSACGMCGTTAVDELRDRLRPLPPAPSIPWSVLAGLGDRFTGDQELFRLTGAVHAAVAFTPDGSPVLGREDIGRHNAVDKVVGRLVLDDALPAAGLGLWVSGRASFEIVQKAWAAGFATVVAVSAPSSLAVEAARLAGMTLCGFARGGELNVYTPDRPDQLPAPTVVPEASAEAEAEAGVERAGTKGA
jgi:FdhD protein